MFAMDFRNLREGGKEKFLQKTYLVGKSFGTSDAECGLPYPLEKRPLRRHPSVREASSQH